MIVTQTPLRVSLAGGGGEELPMELRIEATDDPKTWRWAIRYGGQPVRDYRLIVKDAEKGRHLIDEGNSIKLPATLVGGSLVSSFAFSNCKTVQSTKWCTK